MCVLINELITGVNFSAFERIDREFYRRLLFLWLKERMAQIEIYTPEDQWLCALRLTTWGGSHYQLEVYHMEQDAPYVEATSDPFTLGRLEQGKQGITLSPAATTEQTQQQRAYDRTATPFEHVHVGLLFDSSHHVLAWSELNRAGDPCHLVEKLNPFD